MKRVGRALLLLLALLLAYLVGYAADGIREYRAIVHVNKARHEAATWGLVVLQTRVGWEELHEAQVRCLVGQGWMEDRAPRVWLAGEGSPPQAGSP